MPFTLSHAVAILPLRRWLPPSALAVGAMVPDLPYYLPLPFSSNTTHGWPGALLVTLPVGVAVLVVFQWLLRAPLTALAPEGVRDRLPDRAPLGNGVAVSAALLAGVATHLVWDGFTQVGGFAVVHWPAMRVSVVGAHRVFNVVMYVSSLGGLVVLAGWFALWYRRAAVRPGRWPGVTGWVRGWVLAAGAGVAVLGAAVLGSSDRAAVSLYDLVRCVILGGIGGFGAVLVGYTVAWHVWSLLRSEQRGQA
ncbi:DUF4184 family protein [Streptosporangium amethystogenes]|uniref:DUF4184 family protein n=1 Tax=Streptosporangium amethystogenes TaxID=2002 RepID=UPI0004CB9489|nr:DUF4184 family protein [Streptosporangium amethystogenes]